MPNKLLGWNVETKTAYPTRSVQTNQIIIRKVKKDEVRKRGESSCARRQVEYDEFEKLVKTICVNKDPSKKHGFVAVVALQLHFLGRVDGTCALMVDEIKSNTFYKEFALSFRMCCSKNVMEECLTPSQIMLASRNYNFCTHLTLAMFLELFNPTETNKNGELNYFGSIKKSTEGMKQRVSKFFKEKVFTNDEFVCMKGVRKDIVGTHSIRKFSSTHSRQSGCTRDNVDARDSNRWWISLWTKIYHTQIPRQQQLFVLEDLSSTY